MTELELWCKNHGMKANVFEQVFEDKDIAPDWVKEVYNLGQRKRDLEVHKLEVEVSALRDLFRNLGTHLHLETKRHWWQKKLTK